VKIALIHPFSSFRLELAREQQVPEQLTNSPGASNFENISEIPIMAEAALWLQPTSSNKSRLDTGLIKKLQSY
jgi:hypothetical protein